MIWHEAATKFKSITFEQSLLKFRSIRTANQFIQFCPTFGNSLFLCQFLRNLFPQSVYFFCFVCSRRASIVERARSIFRFFFPVAFFIISGSCSGDSILFILFLQFSDSQRNLLHLSLQTRKAIVHSLYLFACFLQSQIQLFFSFCTTASASSALFPFNSCERS